MCTPAQHLFSLCIIIQKNIKQYKHHHQQKQVDNTDVRIVHGYVYAVEASEGELGSRVNQAYLWTNETSHHDPFVILLTSCMYVVNRKVTAARRLGEMGR